MGQDQDQDLKREQYGWFGEPWPSGICYDDDGRLRTEDRKDFPAGKSCFWCGVAFDEAAGDGGKALPHLGAAGDTMRIVHAHRECLLRQVTGSLAHLEGRCSCRGGDDVREPADRRAEALAVWDRIRTRGSGRGRMAAPPHPHRRGSVPPAR